MEFLPAGYSLVEVVPLGGAPGTYSYVVPPALVNQVMRGRRVVVPFGSGRRAGIVLGPTTAPREGNLRQLEAVLDDGPLLSEEVIELARWAAQYYGMPLSLAIKAALPPDSDAEEERRPHLTAEGRTALKSGAISPTTRRALRALDAGEEQVLKQATVKRLAASGLVAFERTIAAGAAIPMIEVAVRVDAAEAPVFAARQRAQSTLWQMLSERPRIPVSELRASIPTARAALAALGRRGLVRLVEEPWAAPAATAIESALPELTDEQRVALARLEEALGEKETRPFLLQGVTGSGKTEVYLRLIATAREHGATALVLVPEIALTPQLAGRFRARFGPDVAVLHSGLSPRDRAAEWHRVRRGEAAIVVGARSAVFAPLPSPRVVIVDEEHDGSFKQAEGLRYNGRDLAVVRARLAGAVVVLGSATPALETVHNANSGRYERLRLTKRVDARPMPTIALVDLRGRDKVRPDAAVQPSGLLSAQVLEEMHDVVSRHEQVIVFLNRRGHSTSLICQDCGTATRCAQCAVAMTWHERQHRLVCHYCGTRNEAPSVCPRCGSVRLLYAGAGTEKLEDEIRAAAPGARVARLDRDTASTTRKLEALLARFSAGEIDVLVGTQMVAKGHDFPGVTLVCVLLADAGLHQPDFRSAERTAQLLTQVSGRAGRGRKPGRVLIQTYAPEALAIQAVVTQDYDAFGRAELRERAAAEYPPFRRLCLIRVESEQEVDAAKLAAFAARSLAPMAGDSMSILGPAPAPLSKLRNHYRFQVLLKADRPATLKSAIAHLREAIPKPPAGVRVIIDIDPVDML